MNNLSLFAGCVLIWGTTWLAITYQLESVAPEVSVSHRFLLAAAGVAVSIAGNVLVLGGHKS